jgi:hypothetical protein
MLHGGQVARGAVELLPQTEAQLAQQERTWHFKPEYRVEARDGRGFPPIIRCFGMSGYSPIGED